MKIATWNVNSIRSRQLQVVDWLQETKVDVLCLQETKVVDEDFPRSPFEALGLIISTFLGKNPITVLPSLAKRQ
jgi:exodeoxyribonuclease-3